ncbi:MAG: hypothetical protein QOJ09_1041 [Actinomycetota bacterium]|nr:hypothetical protein [Actinomycetota bacterium]
MPAPRLARVTGSVRAVADRIAPQREALRGLHVVPDVDGPRIRLGILWAVVTFAAVAGGSVSASVWFTAAALVAAGNVCRMWRQQQRRPIAPIAVFGAAALPVAAVFGLLAVAGILALIALAAVVWQPLAGALHQPARVQTPVSLTIGVAAGIGLAAAAPVLVRGVGLTQAVVFITLIGVYDASNYLVGSGAASAWEGPAAGAAFILAVTLAVAAVFVPPFRGLTPWLFGFVTALLAPVGPYAASALLPEPKTRAPGLRRLDVWIVAGPVWALFALLLLR